MALVSSMYRMAPSGWAGSADERRVRARKAVARLVAQYGCDAVREAISRYDESSLEEGASKRMLLNAVDKVVDKAVDKV